MAVRGSVRKGSGTKGESVSKWVQSYRAPVSSECRSALTRSDIQQIVGFGCLCLCNTYDCQDFVRFVLFDCIVPMPAANIKHYHRGVCPCCGDETACTRGVVEKDGKRIANYLIKWTV